MAGRQEFNNVSVGTISLVTASNHFHYEGSITTALTTVDMTGSTITNIVYLINDDTVNDLFVAFDNAVPTAAIVNGANGTIRLKPGEALSNIPRSTTKIKMIRAAGSGNVRFMGV